MDDEQLVGIMAAIIFADLRSRAIDPGPAERLMIRAAVEASGLLGAVKLHRVNAKLQLEQMEKELAHGVDG